MSKTMRTFKQEKLWRDKAVDLLAVHGSVAYIKPLSDAEFDRELRIKLSEESEEVQKAASCKELLSELADIYEVLDALLELHSISLEQVRVTQAQKREERGGFAQRCYVTHADHPTGSFGEQYCLADPEKYPEII